MPAIVPEMWFNRRSVTWMGVPIRAWLVANVRRRSWRVHPTTPDALSRAAFDFDHALKDFDGSRRAGKNKPCCSRRGFRMGSAILPRGSLCSRLFLSELRRQTERLLVVREI